MLSQKYRHLKGRIGFQLLHEGRRHRLLLVKQALYALLKGGVVRGNHLLWVVLAQRIRNTRDLVVFDHERTTWVVTWRAWLLATVIPATVGLPYLGLNAGRRRF